MEDLLTLSRQQLRPSRQKDRLRQAVLFSREAQLLELCCSQEPNLDPNALVLPARGSSEVLLIEGKFGKASYMSLSKDRKLIESCAEAYLRDQAKSEI